MVEILTAFGLLLVLSASALPLRLETGEPVLIDFGPDGTAGYPEIEATPLRGTPRVRLSYGCYPAFGEKGDFWRETSARYLGKSFDLPILPASINRFAVPEGFDLREVAADGAEVASRKESGGRILAVTLKTAETKDVTLRLTF